MAEKFRPFRVYSERELKSRRRRRRAVVSLIVAAVLAVFAVRGYVHYSSFFEKTDEAKLVTRTSPLNAEVSGKVAKILVDETETVKAGDPLVQIDAGDFERTLEQRNAELKKVEDQLKGGKVHLDRLEKAVATGGDPARKQYEDALAWYRRVQKKHGELRAAVAEAEAQLKATTIKAPADGHIGQKLVNAGTPVNEGQPVIQFVGEGLPWLIARFEERQLDELKVGQRAEIKVPGIDKTFVGKIESIPTAPPPQEKKSEFVELVEKLLKEDKRVPVRIAFDPGSVRNDVNRLMNGSEAEVKVYVK